MNKQRFPTDETTLTLLIAACNINPDTGRTHLMDFLNFGSIVKSEELLEGPDPMGGDVPTYFVEFEEGTSPFSPNQVIRTLAEELLEIRARGAGECLE